MSEGARLARLARRGADYRGQHLFVAWFRAVRDQEGTGEVEAACEWVIARDAEWAREAMVELSAAGYPVAEGWSFHTGARLVPDDVVIALGKALSAR